MDWKNYLDAVQEDNKKKQENQAATDEQSQAAVDKLVQDTNQAAMSNANQGIYADKSKLDITNTDQVKTAQDAYNKQVKQNQVKQTQAAPWETAVGVNKRAEGTVDPWSTLGSRLSGVQQKVQDTNRTMINQQEQAAEAQAQAEYDKYIKNILADDTARRDAYNAQQKAWLDRIEYYSNVANTQQSIKSRNGIRERLSVDPYAAALHDCETGKGPCAPDPAMLQAASSFDPNNPDTWSEGDRNKMTDAQENLRKRLLDLKNQYENPGFSYGSSDNLSGF